jgi:hypothetical protein
LVVVALAAFLTSAIASGGFSMRALAIAAIAGSVCWLAAAMALTFTWAGNRFGAPLQGVLLGMLVRMGLPLAAVIGLPRLSPELAHSGLLTTILLTYLVALATETFLAVRLIKPATMMPAT